MDHRPLYSKESHSASCDAVDYGTGINHDFIDHDPFNLNGDVQRPYVSGHMSNVGFVKVIVCLCLTM